MLGPPSGFPLPFCRSENGGLDKCTPFHARILTFSQDLALFWTWSVWEQNRWESSPFNSLKGIPFSEYGCVVSYDCGHSPAWPGALLVEQLFAGNSHILSNLWSLKRRILSQHQECWSELLSHPVLDLGNDLKFHLVWRLRLPKWQGCPP